MVSRLADRLVAHLSYTGCVTIACTNYMETVALYIDGDRNDLDIECGTLVWNLLCYRLGRRDAGQRICDWRTFDFECLHLQHFGLERVDGSIVLPLEPPKKYQRRRRNRCRTRTSLAVLQQHLEWIIYTNTSVGRGGSSSKRISIIT
jgi:hypothetical protein